MKSAMMNVMKRKLLTTLWVALPMLGSCHVAGAVSGDAQDADQQRRFKGMGLVLVTDAVAGSEMLGGGVLRGRAGSAVLCVECPRPS
jgi:hypothetical protein